VEQSSYATLTDTLDYLDRLGVNAIELMPVAEFGSNSSWGYNPSFHLAPDKVYGPEQTLKQFVEEAHSRGIAVILDVVYNHVTGQSPLVKLYGNDNAQNMPIRG
jgi:1,4-alpha-glucan branching enzyme